MSINEQALDLNLDKRPYVGPGVTLGQGDHNGTTLVVALWDGAEAASLAGLTAALRMALPGGACYGVAGTVDASAGTATFVIDEAYAASVPGRAGPAYVELTRGTEVIASTSRFPVRVLPAATGDPPRTWDNGVRAWLAEAQGELDGAVASAGAEVSASVGRADEAAADARQAATEARGAVSPDMRLYLAYDAVGDTEYISLVDLEES